VMLLNAPFMLTVEVKGATHPTLVFPFAVPISPICAPDAAASPVCFERRAPSAAGRSWR